MSRARQVANFDPALFAADEVSGDKVHGGTISGSPTLVTPALGTPASGVVTNLSGVLPVGVTGGSGLTALGTVTAGTYNATIGTTATGRVVNFAQQYYLTSSFSGSAAAVTGWTEGTEGKISTMDMSVSSGIWTFPTPGTYFIYGTAKTNTAGSRAYYEIGIEAPIGTTHYGYDSTARTSSTYQTAQVSTIFTVTQANIAANAGKCKMTIYSDVTATTGHGVHGTRIMFIRLGDA